MPGLTLPQRPCRRWSRSWSPWQEVGGDRQTLLDRGALARGMGTEKPELIYLKIGQVIELCECLSCPREAGL